MGNKVRIAVISDIHFSFNKDGNGPEIASAALIQCLSRTEFKYLIVNGDIAFEGIEDDYNLAIKFFDDLFKEKPELTIEHVFFTAGNHDVIRSEVKSILSKFFGHEKKRINIDHRNNFLTFKKAKGRKRNTRIGYFKKVFQGYLGFLEKLNFTPYDNTFTVGRKGGFKWVDYLCGFRELEEGIVIFAHNSSWFCDGDGTGKLVLGKDLVYENIKGVQEILRKREMTNQKSCVISCMHHNPIGHLHWTEKYIDREHVDANYKSISEISDVIITSHEHIPPQSPSYYQSNNLVVSTGSVYDSIGHNNSFKILEIDLDSRSLVVDDYVKRSLDDGAGMYFDLVQPIVLKNPSPSQINPVFEKRIFPFRIDLTSKRDVEEDLFWVFNKESKKKVTDRKIDDFLINEFNSKYAVSCSCIDDDFEGMRIHQYNDIIVYFPKLIAEPGFRKIVKKVHAAFEDKVSLFFISPYVRVDGAELFEYDYGDFGDKMDNFKKIKKKLRKFSSIHLAEIEFISNREIISNERSEFIIDKVANYSKF